MADYVGSDPESPEEECTAVFVDPMVGDFYWQGKPVTDPAVLAELAQHSPPAADEVVVWQPARMASIIREALDGYEHGRQGPGEPTFEYLLTHTKRSAVHLEMRDSYEEVPSFRQWKEGGEARYDWSRWRTLIGPHVDRGVKFRRVRIVSEPVSDYIRWEHAITGGNIEAGEEIRWLPRRRAFDLMLPGADLWLFDQRLIRYGFQRGDGSNPRIHEFTSDPRAVAQVVAAFEMAWERAIPHADYQPE